MELISIKPLLVVLIGVASVPLIILARNNPNVREGVSFATAASMFAIVASMTSHVLDGGTYIYKIFTVLPGIDLTLKVDALGLFFATTATFLWIITTGYSIGYMRSLNEHAQTRYFCCFAIAVFSAVGVAFSANLFTLYLFYEILSVMTYPLVAHHEDDAAWEGSTKYMVYLMGLSKTFLLGAVVLTWMITGTLDFQSGGIFTPEMSGTMVTITYVCFLAGLAKAGFMPFHNWLPDAMVAPTPVSGLLHAVAVVKVGVFSVVRVMLDVFGVETLAHFNLGIYTAFFVSFTIIMASVIAITKNDIKARLAYSTVSQLSYVVIGVALLSPMGILGGIMHIVNHAFSKITLFFAAGSIYVASGLKKIDTMDGIGRKLPFTFTAFTIGAFSMIGVPAVAGFTSKWYMLVGITESQSMGIITETQATAVVFVLLTSTVLNAAYFLPIIYRAFFKPLPSGAPYDNLKEASPFVWVPLCLTGTGAFILGIYPDYFVSIVNVVINGLGY